MLCAADKRVILRRDAGRISIPSHIIAWLFACRGMWAFGLTLLLLAPNAFATSVKLAWDPVSDAQLAGYKVHYGYGSRQYNTSLDVKKNTTTAMSGLTDVKVYYFAVTAYDAAGKQSGYSNEVTYDLSKVDSDGDGLSDWDEISIYRTNPNNPDSDGDGLSDGDEVKIYRTDPTKADTDGDGIPDGVEVAKGSNPLDPQSVPMTTSGAFAVNAGASQYVSSDGTLYQADNKFANGKNYSTTAGIAGTSDPRLYQSERYGNFSYAIPVANGNYEVTLKFAEIYHTSVGRRVFNVSIEGKTVISNLDLVDKVGPRVAYDVVVPVSVSDGMLNITFTSVVDNAKVGAIKVEPKKVVFTANSGGPQYVGADGAVYQADSRFSGGSTYSTTAGIAGTSDPRLYQSERYGNFSYAIPVANGNYEVTLKFAEIYHTSVGRRVFNVSIEGKTVLSKLDIVAKVGAKKAYDVTLPVTVADGVLNIQFSSVVDFAKVSAITVVAK